jgi:spindle assembly abnormal protein 6
MERSVFFEGAVPVRLQQFDREERVAELTVHVLQAASGAGRTASLRFQLSDEADPFFYYWMEIDEESFQSLKSEQCIMVDFSTFPSKVVEMLEASKSSSFECRLIVTSSSSRFEIVETNAFKKIVHLSLLVAHGDDSEVKKYLADKWTLTKNLLMQLTQQHDQLVHSSSVQIQQLVRVTSNHASCSSRDIDALYSHLADCIGRTT